MKTLISKDDLVVQKSKGFAYHEFPYLNSLKYSFDRAAYDVTIGKITVAKIVEDTDGVWHLSQICSVFKSFEGALHGLLRRLNSK